MTSSSLKAGILIFPGAEELDFAGPWEALSMAQVIGQPISACLVAASTDPVRCAKGMRVLPDLDFESCPQLDIIVVPGGQGARQLVGHQPTLTFIRDQASGCKWVTSVCTGAALLGAAGLTSGKRITTNRLAFDFVAKHTTGAVIDRESRVVVDGNLVTGAGVSAGIDMSLKLLGLVFKPEVARDVQKYMEYYPEPPFQDSQFAPGL